MTNYLLVSIEIRHGGGVSDAPRVAVFEVDRPLIDLLNAGPRVMNAADQECARLDGVESVSVELSSLIRPVRYYDRLPTFWLEQAGARRVAEKLEAWNPRYSSTNIEPFYVELRDEMVWPESDTFELWGERVFATRYGIEWVMDYDRAKAFVPYELLTWAMFDESQLSEAK